MVEALHRIGRECAMTGRKRRYPAKLRKQVVELVEAGQRPAALARRFEPSEKTIRNWVRQANVDARSPSGELTTEVRRELMRLKQENERLRMERDILKRAAAWFAAGSGPAAARRTRTGESAGSVEKAEKGLDS